MSSATQQDCKRPGAVFVLGIPAKVWPNSSTASSADILHLAFWSREPKKKEAKKRLEPKWQAKILYIYRHPGRQADH